MKRIFQWAGLTLAALTAVAAQAQTVVRFQDFPGTGLLLGRVAQAKGFCAEAGLKCEFKTIPAAPLGLQTMLAGEIDVAFGPTEVLAAALARKAPVKVIGAGIVEPIFFMAASSEMKLPHESQGYPAVVKDFKGKRIGVTQRGSGAEFQVVNMLKDAGLSANDVTMVAVGSPNTAFPALTKGQVDLIMTFAPADGMCEVLKVCRVVVDPRKGQGPQTTLATRGGSGALMVRADWAAANAPTIAAIRQAMDKADAYIADPANFKDVLAILQKTFGLKMPKADEIAEASLRSSISTFRFRGTTAAMQKVADNMTDNKLLPAHVDISSAVLP